MNGKGIGILKIPTMSLPGKDPWTRERKIQIPTIPNPRTEIHVSVLNALSVLDLVSVLNPDSVLDPDSVLNPDSVPILVMDPPRKGKLVSDFEKENKKSSSKPRNQTKNPKPSKSTPNDTPKFKEDKTKIKVISDEQFDDEWYIDSGCSCHMTGRKEELREFRSLKDGGSVKFGNNSYGTIKGYNMITNGDFSIRKVAYVEGLQHNLISVSQLVVGTEEIKCYSQAEDIHQASGSTTKEDGQNIRSDNGMEFKNKDFEDFLADKGITHNFSAPYTPHQNGIVER
uniref:Integrase catalytic domain-containing protein n=1 Tax=Lactuca sativa TaxID=4236 RepID=A0A9R1V5Z2_LACSA|nr:hypothetical protein LSAT_V11C600321730 [Lactuca sativa]